ncbi:high mobility group family protein [Salix suchowensis]|nr:high mobility group family protein [Salix suchowensis]
MSTLNPTATVNSPQQHELLSETINGQSFRSYPPATAKYEDIAQSADLFWEKLKAFHQSLGTKFMVPTVGGKALDLHHLFVEVTSRGGIEQVITDRKWKEVITAFNFPTTITSASFVLRKHYLSLLYHFEQVYHFNKHIPSVSGTGNCNHILVVFFFLFFKITNIYFWHSILTDAMNGSLVNGSATLEEGAFTNQCSSGQQLQIGGSVSGIIDGKFDNGYLVTVNLGTNQLKGVLYHIPRTFHESQDSRSSDLPPRRRRKRSRLALCDPSQPKSNSSGYNFFFTEHYTQLKPLHNGQEKVIGKKIRLLWNNLTEAEKQASKNIYIFNLNVRISQTFAVLHSLLYL